MSMAAACLATAVIETVFFRIIGYRGRYDSIIVACSNVFTNLIINLLLLHYLENTWSVLALLETGAVVCEYLFYGCAFGFRKSLFFYTHQANVLSFVVGAAWQLLVRM